jgi:hypothetical protein
LPTISSSFPSPWTSCSSSASDDFWFPCKSMRYDWPREIGLWRHCLPRGSVSFCAMTLSRYSAIVTVRIASYPISPRSLIGGAIGIARWSATDIRAIESARVSWSGSWDPFDLRLTGVAVGSPYLDYCARQDAQPDPNVETLGWPNKRYLSRLVRFEAGICNNSANSIRAPACLKPGCSTDTLAKVRLIGRPRVSRPQHSMRRDGSSGIAGRLYRTRASRHCADAGQPTERDRLDQLPQLEAITLGSTLHLIREGDRSPFA